MKSILLHVQDDAGLDARLQAALSIVRASGGHLTCLHVTPINIYVGYDGLGGGTAMPSIYGILEEHESKMRARIEGQLAHEDISWDYERTIGDPAQMLVGSASLADLIVLGRDQHRENFYTSLSLIGDALQSARTPILVQPEELTVFDPFGVALVAWNGSFEAANALRAAMPLLKYASDVHIVTVEESKDHLLPSTAASTYLSRHGVTSELHTKSANEVAVNDVILTTAEIVNAKYLVMGAYGHSRAREFLFGGVTRSLLKVCPISLIMAR